MTEFQSDLRILRSDITLRECWRDPCHSVVWCSCRSFRKYLHYCNIDVVNWIWRRTIITVHSTFANNYKRSFGGEVKPSVPCRRFAACKRSLNLRGSRKWGKITGQISRSQFHLSLLGSLASLRTYGHLAKKVGTSKGGGKQCQTTPRTCPGYSVPEPYRSHD